MRKSDMIAYRYPVRKLGQLTIEEGRGYAYYLSIKGGQTYIFMIRKDSPKSYQVDEYYTGLKIGGNYPTIARAQANIIWMIRYKGLLQSIDKTICYKKMKGEEVLNPVSALHLFPASCFKLNGGKEI